MSDKENNKEILDNYLLGLLSDQDSEKFDELSITNDDFAGELQSAENELIDAYLNNELSDSTLERFESYYLASPLRREKVEFARALQIVAKKHLVVPDQSAEDQSQTGFFSTFFTNFGLTLRFGLLVLGVGFIGLVIWILLQNISPKPDRVKIEPTPIQETSSPSTTTTPNDSPTVTPTIQTTATPTLTPTTQPTTTPTKTPLTTPKPVPTEQITPSVPSLATFILLPPKRDGNTPQTITIPAQTTNVGFTLPIESDDFKIYLVTLKSQSGAVLWKSGKLTSKKNSLSLRFPAKFLQSDIYIFTLAGVNENGIAENIADYSFRSVLK